MNYKKELDKLRKKIDLIEAEIKKEEPILVPKRIQFENISEDKLGLVFDEDRTLFTDYEDESKIIVSSNYYPNNIQCKLVPCKREDLKPGDWAYRKNENDVDLKKKSLYGLIVGENKHYFIRCNEDIVKSSTSCWKHWWKVERV